MALGDKSLIGSSTFEGLLESAPDAIVGVDARGIIVLANGQSERLFDYDRSELIGQPVEILVPDSAKAVHPHHRANYFGQPTTRPMGVGLDLAGRRKDGTEFPAEISLSSLVTDEHGIIVSAAIRDITERKEAEMERARLEAQLRQSRIESVGQLAGGIAHDFNNLLAVILNYAEFVSDSLSDSDPLRADVEEIRGAAARAASLTHQLLTFSRREVVQPIVLNLNEVVRDIEKLLRRSIGEQIELVTRLADDTWLVKGDLGQIEQVLVNLAVNGRDAMPGGGRLTIETSNAELDEPYAAAFDTAPGIYVQLTVSDTGSGMTEEQMERAFEPFFTTKEEGTGLGLSTVYGVVRGMGGVARIYSEIGIGTTVRVYLPPTQEQIVQTHVEKEESLDSRGETILVVEDEAAVRQVAARILQGRGYGVIEASNGVEAIDLVKSLGGRVDLVLSDVVMPQMSGKEMYEKVKQDHPNLKILFMSGYTQSVFAHSGLFDDRVRLVEKPFSSERLLRAVRGILDEG